MWTFFFNISASVSLGQTPGADKPSCGYADLPLPLHLCGPLYLKCPRESIFGSVLANWIHWIGLGGGGVGELHLPCYRWGGGSLAKWPPTPHQTNTSEALITPLVSSAPPTSHPPPKTQCMSVHRRFTEAIRGNVPVKATPVHVAR